jgi:hypothetical protein
MADLRDWVDVISIAASIATILTLPYAAYQVRLSKMSSSTAAAAIMFSQISAKLELLLSSNATSNQYQMTVDLLNEMELCCAVYLDGQLAGYSGKFARVFLKDVLEAVEHNEMLLGFVRKAIHTPHTFECIRIFCRRYKTDWEALS